MIRKNEPLAPSLETTHSGTHGECVRLLFVCLGNICRSTMAESVMTYLVRKEKLQDKIVVASAATSTEEIGNTPHYGTVDILQVNGIPLVPHRAVQMTKKDYETYDLLIGMDSGNIRSMQRICGGDAEGKIHRLLEYTGENRDIADPWYTGRFSVTYRDVYEGCLALLDKCKEMLQTAEI